MHALCNRKSPKILPEAGSIGYHLACRADAAKLSAVKQPVKRLLYWAPRILGLVIGLFLGLFAFDVFGHGHGFLETALAFIVHLIPTALVLIALAIGWQWELAGALLFLGLGVCYAVMAFGHPTWILIVAGPIFLVSFLFLLSWIYRKDPQLPTTAG